MSDDHGTTSGEEIGVASVDVGNLFDVESALREMQGPML
jgi:hypothetical protein